jgi:hypothetical protein
VAQNGGGGQGLQRLLTRLQFHPDPVLYYEVPADGHYDLEIKDAIYRGREDFVYRITLPSTGTYFVCLGDTQHHGGSHYGYRLRVSPPQPDFQLR